MQSHELHVVINIMMIVYAPDRNAPIASEFDRGLFSYGELLNI